MKKAFRALPLALIALLVFAGSAFAQDSQYCGDLAQEDCDLLYGADEANQSSITGTTTDWDVELSLMNLPQVPFQDIGFTVDQSYTYNVSEEGGMAMMSLDPMGDRAAFADGVADFFSGVSLDLSSDVTFSEELATLIEGTAGIAWPNDVTINARIVDGVLYFDQDALADSVPELAGSLGEGWVGYELAPLLRGAALNQQALRFQVPAGLGVAPGLYEVSVDSVLAGLGMNALPGPLVSDLTAIDPSDTYVSLLSIERLDDGESMSGEEAASFETTVDFNALVQSDLYGGLVGPLAPTLGMDQAQLMQISQLAAPVVASNLDLSLTENIGMEDSYLYDSHLVLDLDLTSLLEAAAAFGLEGLGGDGDATALLDVLISNSDINAGADIEAPEGAGVVAAEDVANVINASLGQ